MLYRSTRQCESNDCFPFRAVILQGLAPDGGLFVPAQWPSLPAGWLTEWQACSVEQLCMHLFPHFMDTQADSATIPIPRQDLESLVKRSFCAFTHVDRTPLIPLPAGLLFPASTDNDRARPLGFLLELFHGPTFAFKDVALQFLGNLFEYYLDHMDPQSKQRLTVLGATSGDTGGAAIYGLKGKRNMDLFILHPHQRVSLLQSAQMCTVLDDNVHNVAIHGTFDDCQDIVKRLFQDVDLTNQRHLGAVNSINWARIMAQMVYYFHSYFAYCRLSGTQPSASNPVRYAVPTGNFGDILAGYYAQRSGLPIDRFMIATNANDILTRFLETGVYSKRVVTPTCSPAMDIQVSSNFERFLWHIVHDALPDPSVRPVDRPRLASKVVAQWMHQLAQLGQFTLESDLLQPWLGPDPCANLMATVRSLFSAHRSCDADITATIRIVYEASRRDPVSGSTPLVIDPHTAVGIHAAQAMAIDPAIVQPVPIICLATAHPSKFLSAVLEAISPTAIVPGDSVETERRALQSAGQHPIPIPEQFLGILERPQRCLQAPNSVEAVKAILLSK